MNLLILSCYWVTILTIMNLCTFMGLSTIDPTDDFSFSLLPSNQPISYSLIKEQRVTEILMDRLDQFPKSQTPRLAKHLIALSEYYRLDPSFILSLIEVESSFKIRARSPVGALGLMQIMPSTAKYVIEEFNLSLTGYEYFKNHDLESIQMTPDFLMEPFVNILIGTTYLAWLRDNFEASYYTLAAYNLGPYRMEKLLAKKSFTPVLSRKYFLDIRRNVPEFRFYQSRRKTTPLKAWI